MAAVEKARKARQSAGAGQVPAGQRRENAPLSESRFGKLVELWPGAIFSQRADFSFQSADSKMEKLTGLAPEALCNGSCRFWELVHEADVEEVRRQCAQALKTPGGITTSFRVRHAATGRVSYVLEHREAILDGAGGVMGYDVAWLDVTRQTIAERRLSQAAWKETLALLTMGLAHDFNNVLSGILSLSELVLAQSGPEAPHSRSLQLIKDSVLQAAQIMQRVVSLHRGTGGSRQYLDLNKVVPEVAELVRKVLPRRLRVETELTAGELPVYMDEVGFRQVVLNLALNAADAMPDRGRLLFRLTVPETAQPLSHAHGKFPRLPCVCFSVKDNGVGIAARHLPHLFDPFFTTKPITKGSGLGLYNARVFVEDHGGAISVESAEKAGATFHLWLPQADFTEAETSAAQRAERRRTLLLVGPPGAAVEGCAELLRTHDFCVITTNSAARALEPVTGEEVAVDGTLVLAEPSNASLLPTRRRVICRLRF
ncbi:putative Histidine kinase [Verrucomicrobia bacterium]|nr:putative Histidine kinase [Verrucomicrobiota bacterium]